MLYETYAVPTLSYVAQLGWPPKQLLMYETAGLARVLHVPHNAFSRADYFSVNKWGSVRFPSLFCTLVAALVRAALVTIADWQINYDISQAGKS